MDQTLSRTHPGQSFSGWRPERCERIALVLQGGGALGAYQAGVYQALAEADLHPDWVAGISIGAINAAIIAGNAPTARVDRLRAFWESITENPLNGWTGLLAEVSVRSVTFSARHPRRMDLSLRSPCLGVPS